MKTATFSNGHVDVYKGKRPVTAAWMVVTPKGSIRSGHSIDEKTALTTARGNAALASGFRSMIINRRFQTIDTMRYLNKVAREAGFKDSKAHEADIAAKRAAFVAQCRIEVVAL